MHWELGPVTVGGIVDKFHVHVGSQSELNIELSTLDTVTWLIRRDLLTNNGQTER